MIWKKSLFFLAVIDGLGLSWGQIIKPKPYDHIDSLSYCKHGLISDIDTVVFKYEVDLTDDPLATDVYFQTKKKDDIKYNFLCHMNFTEKCNNRNDNDDCLCQIVKENVREITIKIKAHISFNAALIRGNIINSKTSNQFRSEESNFPAIYDYRDTKGKLTINKIEITDEDKCNELVKDSELVLTYTCISPAVPCLIEISTDVSTHTARGNGTVIYYGKFNSSKMITVTIKRAPCTFSGHSTTKICTILLDSVGEKETQFTENNMIQLAVYIILITTITTSLLIFFGFAIAFLIFKKKGFKEKLFVKSTLKKRNGKEKKDDEKCLITFKDVSDVKIDILTSKKGCFKTNPIANVKKMFMNKRDFTIEKLPRNMQDEDICDLINSMADLTVMVTFSDKFGNIKVGTGWIASVSRNLIKDSITCLRKINKDSPSDEIGELTVYTSTDVVPPNAEGVQVKCSIMFDDTGDEVIELTGYQVESKYGKCKIKFKTCSIPLLNKIYDQKQRVYGLNNILNKKYKNLRDCSMDLEDTERLTIIVSYNYGLNKCVSLGFWTHRSAKIDKEENIEITKYKYTNPTYPGSTGAYVYILGRAHLGWIYQHRHVGVNSLGEGFSGYGMDAI